jgi:plastocyanin
MDSRYSFTLVSVIIVAVFIGVVAARSQAHIVAAPVPTSTPTPVPTPAPNQVEIVTNPGGSPDAFYIPPTLAVRVGQKVTWINLATDDHSATSDTGAFNSDVLSRGESFSWTPQRAGRYPYSDFLHPDMRGSILVSP